MIMIRPYWPCCIDYVMEMFLIYYSFPIDNELSISNLVNDLLFIPVFHQF